MTTKSHHRFLIAWAFLLPNFIGFLIFTAGPVLFSLWMAFTDWSLVKHNDLSDTPVDFIGFENFRRLLVGDESEFFWSSFYNTAYLMIGIPIGIAGSLMVALALNRPIGPRVKSSKIKGAVLALMVGTASAGGAWVAMYPGSVPETPQTQSISNDEGGADRAAFRMEQDRIRFDQRRANSAASLLFISGIVVALGLSTGVVFFRTLFYLPSLLSGIALFLLWKSLYKPTGGAINEALRAPLNILQNTVSATPAGLWYTMGWITWIIFAGVCAYLLWVTLQKTREGDFGLGSMIGSTLAILSLASIGLGIGYWLCQLPAESLFATGFASLEGSELSQIRELIAAGGTSIDPRELAVVFETIGASVRPHVLIESLNTIALDDAARTLVRDTVLTNATSVHLGFTSGQGLQPPNWLVDETWAKPALIMMGVWTAVGGGNMLLYLAGLSNIPETLYEAASIDGAGPWSRFWNVTWPQLAPTTFFIVIMSTIGGLQGGFDQARAMTEGKYGTEVLTYYLYNRAFTDEFQLGLASAVAWVMFAMIFVMTVVNYRFGSRMVND